MTELQTKAATILVRTALSKDDVVAETTIEIVSYQLTESVQFFRQMIADGGVSEQSMDMIVNLCENGEMLHGLLNKDYNQEIEFSGTRMPVYKATSEHLRVLAGVLRKLILHPEWNEYYNDMARKLDEYADGLSLDPTSYFRAI
mmetsp:Transcript_2975/g.5203  ORF Transcript_2975/g.5203 Transcript_2975/m.5203 type:complete len:144 (+) Transcript_2975:1221-1652(+)